MNHIHWCWIFFLSLALACSSSGVERPSDGLSLRYSVKNVLHTTDTRIELVDDSLTVYHTSGSGKGEIAERFPVDTSESHEVSRYLRSIHFHDMPKPQQERVLDAPEETLTAIFDGRSTTLSIGGVSHLPEEIVTLRKQLLDIAIKHSAALKSALGY